MNCTKSLILIFLTFLNNLLTNLLKPVFSGIFTYSPILF